MITMEGTDLSEEQKELLLAYVESNTLGKLTLSDAQKEAVYRLLADSRNAREFVKEETRLMGFAADIFNVEVDPSKDRDLATWILAEVGADEDVAEPEKAVSSHSHHEETKGEIIEFPRARPPIGIPWMVAIAASITLFLLSGVAGSHFYYDLLTKHDRLALRLAALSDIESSQNDALQIAKDDARKWKKAAEKARYEGDLAAVDLADAQFAISSLEIEQATLQGRYESTLRDEAAQSEAELEQARQDREQLRAQITQLGEEVTRKQQALASLAEGRNVADLNTRLRMTSLESELTASKSWIRQVADYHRLFANQPREFLVERTADETDAIKDMLAPAFERGMEIPDLSALDITFVGARLLGVNGDPVAQLVYLDPDDKPMALCIMPLEKGAKDPTAGKNSDLNLVDWRDGKHGFLLVGWTDADLMTEAAKKVRPYYEL